MKNSEVANLLYNIADLLEIQNVPFKPQAYRNAARIIETLAEDIETVFKNGKLRELPGIGESIAEKISEFLTTGKLKYYEDLKKKVPKGVAELIEIPGMGPKKALFLNKELGISSVQQLKEAALKHKIRGLPRFGEKSESDILEAVELIEKGKERMLLGIALPIANELSSKLKALSEVDKISLAGSIRRRKETIGDVDILVTSKKPLLIMDFFTSMKDVAEVLAKGETKSSVVLKSGLQIDLRVVDSESFGSALQYFTGSKEHNIALRGIVKKKGFKLSEYGLFNQKGKNIASKTEKEIYEKLGLRYIEPEIRENSGEIEAAISNKLPKLVEYNAMKGDFHVHSKYSDGTAAISEIAELSKKLGYEYVVIADHSKSQHIANGLDEETLFKKIEEIKKLNKKYSNFRILAGAEVDIKPDGTLDYSDDVLKKLDVAIAAIHSGFKSTKEQMTKRVIKALENKYVDILAHPTGRLIGKRNPYEIDIEKIIASAKENGKFLEINAFPSRLDLRDANVRAAVNAGVKLSIGTDAHALEQMRFLELGVATARRGWAESKDILNTLSLKELPKFFKKIS